MWLCCYPRASLKSPDRRTGASLRTFYFLEAELLVEIFVRLTVDLDVGIDEVVERWAILFGRQYDVATRGKLHAIGVNSAKEIVLLLLSFPRLRNVNRDPADFVRIELSPAVITANISFGLVFRHWKTDVEASRNPVSPQKSNERRMEVCAVSALGVTSPQRVPASPT